MIAIPKFLISRLYVRNSLRQLRDGRVVFRVTSGMLSGHLTGVEQVVVGGHGVPGDAVTLVVNGQAHAAVSLSAERPLHIAANQEIEVQLVGVPQHLPSGRYAMQLVLWSEELGRLDIPLEDELMAEA